MVDRDYIGDIKGEPVLKYTLGDPSGAHVQFINYGARLTSIIVPDKNGKLENVILSYPHWKSYIDDKYYMGAIIGRVANVIHEGIFTLNKKQYNLDKNEGDHHFHGGPSGFSFQLWKEEIINHEINHVTLSYTSPDEEGGYPGAVKVYVSYTWTQEKILLVEIVGQTDSQTYLNISMHPYFNLAPGKERDIKKHQFKFYTRQFMPVKEHRIPTGKSEEIKNQKGFNFRELSTLDSKLKQAKKALENTNNGFDHCFKSFTKKENTHYRIAEIKNAAGTRNMEIFTDYPAFQFYTGQDLIEPSNSEDAPFQRFGGFCIEPQYVPNAPNISRIKKPLIQPGDLYQHRILYRFNN